MISRSPKRAENWTLTRSDTLWPRRDSNPRYRLERAFMRVVRCLAASISVAQRLPKPNLTRLDSVILAHRRVRAFAILARLVRPCGALDQDQISLLPRKGHDTPRTDVGMSVHRLGVAIDTVKGCPCALIRHLSEVTSTPAPLPTTALLGGRRVVVATARK